MTGWQPTTGERYQLRPPTTLASSHPHRVLQDEVRKFISYHANEQIEGKDPVTAGGIATVGVISIGHTVEAQTRTIFGMEGHVKPLKRPVPGVMIHLARWAVPRAIVEVPIEQVIQLGLNPEGRYFVRGSVWPEALMHDREDADYDELAGKVIEEKDFIIPNTWLCKISDEDYSSQWRQKRLDEDLRKFLGDDDAS